MFRKDVKHVNWPSLEVLTLRVCKCETRRKSAVKSLEGKNQIVDPITVFSQTWRQH